MLLLGVVGWMAGCASTGESAGADTKLVANVGNYPPGPSGVNKPRVGVPPFKVTTGGGFSGGKDLNDLAADQMNTLLRSAAIAAYTTYAYHATKSRNADGIRREGLDPDREHLVEAQVLALLREGSQGRREVFGGSH